MSKQLTFDWIEDPEDETSRWISSRSESLMEKCDIAFDMVEYENPNSWGVSDSCYAKQDLSGINYLPDNWLPEDYSDECFEESIVHHTHNDAPERYEEYLDDYTLSAELIKEYSSYAQQAKEQMERPSDKKRLKMALTEILDTAKTAYDSGSITLSIKYADELRIKTNMRILETFISNL